MSRSRKLADLLDANGDVKSANLDNVPSSTNASALTSGTLPIARIADDAVTAAKLANSINSEIAANTAKTGITTSQANAITANTAKTGITTSQANAITANTAKVTNATHTGEVTGATALTIANDAVTVAKLNLVSTSSVPSLEAKGDGSSQDGYIQLNCSQNSHGIKLKSPPHSANASYTLTFPNNDGNANEYLQTNGSGVMAWASVSSGATGGGTDKVFVENSQTITTDYTIPSGKSASCTGPITMNSGVDITLSAGSRWVIL